MVIMYGNTGAVPGLSGMIAEGLFSYESGGYTERSLKRPRFNEPNPYLPVSGMTAPGLVETYDMPGPTSGSKRVRIFDPNPYMMGPAFYSPSYASSIPCVRSTSCMRYFPVVRLRVFPFNCKGPDIYNFFMGLFASTAEERCRANSKCAL